MKKDSAIYFKKMRLERGLTQQDVSDYLGYSSKQIVSNWERGVCTPPLNALSALIKLLKLDQDKIFDIYLEETKILVNKHLSSRQKIDKTKTTQR